MRFYILLAAAFILTISCGAIAAYMALYLKSTASPEAKSIAANAALMFAFGMGNIVGLLSTQRW